MDEPKSPGNNQKPSGKARSAQPLNVRLSETGALIHFKRPPLLLTNFPHEIAEQFIRIGHEERRATHEEFLRKGQVGRDMFLICEGTVSVWNQGVRLALLSKGDVFGELILFRDNYRIASVRAEEPVQVLRFGRQVIMDFFARQGQNLFDIYMMNIIEVLRRKLIETNKRVVELERMFIEK